MHTAEPYPRDMANAEDEEENGLAEARQKKLSLKLQKLKLRKSLHQQRSLGSAGFNIGAVYELKLRKLRKNNKALAKALADQKIETQQWYNELITLKRELQDAHERLLRSKDKNYEVVIEREVERRIKEIGEPLNTAISQAMENLLVVVENFSKVKQLANARNATTKSPSSFSFPRSSGSRVPLGSCGNTSSPCRSVRPMVSGHVLQPAMVAIQKLDDVWKARVKERIEAREGEEMDMSTIGEQSGVIGEGESTLGESSLDSADPTVEQTSDSLEVSAAAESPSPRSLNTSRRRGKSKSDSNEALRSPVSIENSSSVATPSPPTVKGAVKIKPVSMTVPGQDEDPLEGPSWLYSDSNAPRRGRGRGRGHGRGRKRGRSSSSARHSSPATRLNRPSLEESSENEEDELQRKKSKTQSSADNKSPAAGSPTHALEHSYLASPATMLNRLENLEAKSGRRSKSKSKGRSLRISGAISESTTKQQQSNDSFTLVLSNSVTEKGCHSPDVDPQLCEAGFMPPPAAPPPRFDSDFLIRDTDLTCIGDVSMDMTEPMSKILSQVAAELRMKDGEGTHKYMGNDRKFFKNQTSSQLQKSPSVEKTPFDLSLMDASHVAIPPYTSQKSVEKENMPPAESSSSELNIKEDILKEEAAGLRKVSVVLEDVMKSTEAGSPYQRVSSIYSSEEKTNSKEKNANLNCSKKKGPPRNKKLLFYANHSENEDDEEEEEDEDNWSPSHKNNKTVDRRQSSKRGRKSSAAKKKDLGNDITVSPRKRQRKRNIKCEAEIHLAAADVHITEEKVEGNSGKKFNRLDRNSIAVSSVTGSDDENKDKSMGLSECYVKICRTPVTEVQKSLAPVDESYVELNELPDLMPMMENVQAPDVASATIEESTQSSEAVQVVEDITEPSETLTESQEAKSDHVVPDKDSLEVEYKDESCADAVLTSNVSLTTLDDENRPTVQTDSEVKVEADAPRRRRGAAMKIMSFKEPTLNKKMRQERDSIPGLKVKPNRKSGRKSLAS